VIILSEEKCTETKKKSKVSEVILRRRVLKNLEGFGIHIRRYMKYTQSKKMEIIRMVKESPCSLRQTLLEIGVSCNTFYEVVQALSGRRL
jgi:hypothetical protein